MYPALRASVSVVSMKSQCRPCGWMMRARWAEPSAGYMHRGYEKLTEYRTYPQITTLINRIDWLSSFANEVPFATLAEAVAKAGGAVLEKQWLFDVYEGAGILAGTRSLAVALQLRKPAGNFTDEEANQVRDRIVAALVALGATIR